MTNKEAVNRVRSSLSGSGFISDDSKYPPRRILASLHSGIAAIKEAHLSAGKDLGDSYIYTLGCVPMEEVDRSDFPNIPPSGYMWMKSKTAIPKYLKLIGLTDLLGNDKYDIINWDRLREHSKSRNAIVAKTPIASFRNINDTSYLYLMNTSLEAVTLTFIPNIWMEAVLFPQCDFDGQRNCDYWDIDIGASGLILEEAMARVLQTELQIYQVPPDQKNNDSPVI